MAAPLGLAASTSADQLAVPAADAVASGRLRGSGGEGGWAAGRARGWTVSGAGASPAGAGGAGGAAITAPTKLTSSTVMNTRKTNRAAFVRAAWVMGCLHCPAGASDAGPGRGETRPGPFSGVTLRYPGCARRNRALTRFRHVRPAGYAWPPGGRAK